MSSAPPLNEVMRVGERGAALIFVLWLITAITLLVTGMSASRNAIVLDTHVAIARLRAKVAIDSALEVAVEQLRGQTVHPDGKLELKFDDVTVSVLTTAESGRIDLNGASDELIGGLVSTAVEDRDEAAKLTDAILDWRDENDLRHPQGAEESDYRRAELGYAPANGPFRYAGQLRLVLGMTPDIAKRLEPMVTTETGSDEIDLSGASASVFRAHDLAQGLDVGTGPLTEEDNQPPPFTTDSSGLYRIDLQAVVDGGFTSRAVAIAWVYPTTSGRDYEIMDYQGWLLPRDSGSNKG
ncbi:MAG: type II secretion system protein GspK [Geminicoccaceae bacterium]